MFPVTALCVNEGEQMPAVKCVLLFELFISLALVKGPGVWSQWSDHIIRDTCSFFFLVCSFFFSFSGSSVSVNVKKTNKELCKLTFLFPGCFAV